MGQMKIQCNSTQKYSSHSLVIAAENGIDSTKRETRLVPIMIAKDSSYIGHSRGKKLQEKMLLCKNSIDKV